MKGKVFVEREVTQPLADGDVLCYQKVRYCYSNDPEDFDAGYRFIRRRDGKLRALRGQTNVCSPRMSLHMIENYLKRYPEEEWRPMEVALSTFGGPVKP